ncbi:hypothetical protein LINPERPRIM_LOCUS27950 [Linum perenne]
MDGRMERVGRDVFMLNGGLGCWYRGFPCILSHWSYFVA